MYRSISAASKKRIIGFARDRGSFADVYPDKQAIRCLNPGCAELTTNDVPLSSSLYFEWQCDKNMEHLWPTTVKNRGKYKCPHCHNESKPEKLRRAKTQPSKTLAITHPHLFKLLIKVNDSRGIEFPKDNVCTKSNAKGYWKPESCDHPPFWSKIADRVRADKTKGCRICKYQEVGKAERERSVALYGPLSQTHPGIAKEWLCAVNEFNEEITPEMVSLNSKQMVSWECAAKLPSGLTCGHRYKARVVDRTKGKHGCFNCAKINVLGKNKIAEAIENHGAIVAHPVLGWEFVSVEAPESQKHLTAADIPVTSHYKCRWRCQLHPSVTWISSPGNRTRFGVDNVTGCDLCGREKRRLWGFTQGLIRTGSFAEVRPELVESWISCNEPNQTPFNTSAGSKIVVKWKCLNYDNHQHWDRTVSARTSGVGCPDCFELKRKTLSKMHALRTSGPISTSRPELAAEFLACISNPSLTPDTLTYASGEICDWKCRFHGEVFTMSVVQRKLVNGQLYGCKSCGKEALARAIRESAIAKGGSLQDNFPDIAAQWVRPAETRHAKLTPETTPARSGIKVLWQCSREKCKHQWPATVGNRVAGYGCPRCDDSKGERFVSNVLEDGGILFQRQYTFKNFESLYKGINKKRYDFAVLDPEGKGTLPLALIEYHGFQHYNPTNFGNKNRSRESIEEEFRELQKRDKQKLKFAMDIIKIPILVIPFLDFDNIRQLVTDFLSTIPTR